MHTNDRRLDQTSVTATHGTDDIIISSEDAILTKSLDGIITSWNPGAVQLFGYTAAEAIGQPMLSLFPPERVSEESEILFRLGRGERIDHFETVRVAKDGRRLDVSVSLSPLRNGSGVVVGASKIVRDISERKRAEANFHRVIEAERRQATSRLQSQLGWLDLLRRVTHAIGQRHDMPSILQVVVASLEDCLPIELACCCRHDAASNSLIVTNIGSRSVSVATELGLEFDAVITIDRNGLARCVSGELVHEPDVAAVLSYPFCQRLVAAGLRSLVAVPLVVDNAVTAIFLLAQRRAGAFSSTDCEFLKQLGEHVALAVAQSQLHRALQKAYDELRLSQQAMMQQERLRALGQMAGGIAHDINNAITPALMYTESMLEDQTAVSGKARKQLTTVKRAIEDVAHTVARLREFFRRDDPQATPGQVDLNETLMEVLDLTRARWSDMPQQRGVVIVLDTDLRAGLPKILGIASEIREALINLLFNAVDAMPSGGTLTVRTRSNQLHVEAEICDTGIGMDADTCQRCMEPFFTTKGERGTGIGLAMVYGITQRHGAEFMIDSALGKGTTMRLVFPLPQDLPLPVALPTPIARIRSLRILVIDDDPRLLQTMVDFLGQDGHEVMRAIDGKAGVNAFIAACASGKPPDVVITDLGMPYLDGSMVAKAIKASSPTTPVILLTGWGQRLIGDRMPAEIDRIVDKPPTLQALRKALAEVVNSPALLASSPAALAAPAGTPPSILSA